MNALTVDNWKEYVNYQGTYETKSDASGKYIFYIIATLILDGDSEGSLGFRVKQLYVDKFPFTEEQLVEQLKKELASFPDITIESPEDLSIAQIKVAMNSRRGRANIECERSHYYKGSSAYDGPLFVLGYDGKFAIRKHPKFELYGFVIKEKKDGTSS